jgi:hypothetical protein
MEFLLAATPTFSPGPGFLASGVIWCIIGTLILKIVMSLGGSSVTLGEAFITMVICGALQTFVALVGVNAAMGAPTIQARKLIAFIFIPAYFFVQPLVISWWLSVPIRGGCFITLAMLGLQIVFLVGLALLVAQSRA